MVSSALVIHEDMVVSLAKNAHSYSMVKKWAAEFKRGRDSLENTRRRRRSVTVTGDHCHIDEYWSSTLPLSWVSPRTASMHSSTTNFICSRCQHVVSRFKTDSAQHDKGKF